MPKSQYDVKPSAFEEKASSAMDEAEKKDGTISDHELDDDTQFSIKSVSAGQKAHKDVLPQENKAPSIEDNPDVASSTEAEAPNVEDNSDVASNTEAEAPPVDASPDIALSATTQVAQPEAEENISASTTAQPVEAKAEENISASATIQVAKPEAQDITHEVVQELGRSDATSPVFDVLHAETTQAAIERIKKEDIIRGHRPIVAKMPKSSRAAAAQRLGDQPQNMRVGVNYEASHLPLHDPKWRIKRHWKRKILHLSRSRDKANERVVTKWVVLPITLTIITIIVLTTTIFVSLNLSVNATTTQYHAQVITLADVLPLDNLKMYDGSGHLLYQAIDQGVQTTEPLNEISPNLQNAEVAIEDQTFWTNNGFDITGIVRAAVSDLNSGHIVSGGSTITQQLIKNTIVGNSETAVRKLEEIELAPEVTRYYTKQQILSMYLNTIYYGSNAYGAEAASQTYFGLQDKPSNPASNQLDIAQAAMLAGIPSSPDTRNPVADLQNSLVRTRQVLLQMYNLKTIDAQQYTAALEEIQKPNFAFYHAPLQSTHSLALSSFTNYALTELANDLGKKMSDLSRSGLTVTTTVNANLQVQVLKDAQNDIAAIRDAHNITDSSVVMINPKTGAIETLIGNIDPAHNQYDVATEGFRQAGSTMKAFTYVTAFENGVSPGQKTLDELQTFNIPGTEPYTPDNYHGIHHGLITYRQALDWSLNIDAVKLELSPYVGVQNDYDTAERLGLGQTNASITPSFTLGSPGVHLLNETSAYGTFANGGVHVPPHAINTVTNAQGKIIYTASTTGKRAISQQAAYILTNVLSDNATRDGEFGSCEATGDVLDLHEDNVCSGAVIPAAVKTGTSNDFRDNLTIGYTPNLVTGVWSGNDNNSQMNDIIGVTGAGTIWHDAMMTVLQGQAIQQFNVPAGVVHSAKYNDLVKM